MQVYSRPNDLEQLINLALSEDIGIGDITTKAVFLGNELANGRFIAKESGVIAGLELTKSIFKQLSPLIKMEMFCNDGDFIEKGFLIANLSGPADKILTGERTVLNFMQRMSGIATSTRQYADAINHTKAKVLDTRKTVPGHRITDKWAVKIGGGENHRIRLDDRFLIKENHIAVAGSISSAINRCLSFKKANNLDAKIEIEVQNLDELKFLLQNHADDVTYVMLDNMSLEHMKAAVELNKHLFLLEASGNVTLERMAKIAETGVDYISSGSLTHSVKALDISLILDL